MELYSYSQKQAITCYSLIDKHFFYLHYFTYNDSNQAPYTNYIPLTRTYQKAFQEVIATESVSDVFLFRRHSSIKSFFNSQFVDIPVCFQKSKSLYALTFEIPFLKMINILMRSGLKTKILANITSSFSTVLLNLYPSFTNPTYFNWVMLHYILNTFLIDSRSQPFYVKLPKDLQLPVYKGDRIEAENYYPNSKVFLKTFFLYTLQPFLPIFSFYIRKVDKSIRKNSRGKSGKYSIIWKYVPTYKRLYVVIRWLLRDLKFQKLQSFEARLVQILETFFYKPQTSFLVRLRKFVHNFVFYNFKQTLLKHLKSTS